MLSVAEAAYRLGVDESRVRQLLRAGRLSGHRMGRAWLVSDADVARLAGHALGARRPSGRPLSPPRAWALLDLLEGGAAPWLSPSARSQVRAIARNLSRADAARWRAALRARADVIPCRVHPAALSRLGNAPEVVPAGPVEAARRGIDLVAFESLPEVYVEPDAWPNVVRLYRVAERPPQPNLLVRLPRGGWWPDDGRLGSAVLAADLLDSPEPRAVSAGAALLHELAVRSAR